MLEENIVEGLVPHEAMPILRNMLNGYLSQWNRIYIGATAHPEIRCRQHMEDGWYKMVLIYEAYSPKIARDLEQALIEYARQCNFLSLVENIGRGGEGLGNARRSNYVYLLCGR